MLQHVEEDAYYLTNQREWARFAPFYDTMVAPMRGLRRRVERLLEVGPGLRILDVATGTGAQALAFAAKGADVVGIDLSEAMLAVARRKNHFRNLTFRRADATSLPFPEGSFDIAGISFALHEMPPSIRSRVVAELARVTKPGGRVYVVDYGLPPNALARWLVVHVVKLWERHQYAEFVRSDVLALLGRAGISVDQDLRTLPLASGRILICRTARAPRD